MGIPLRSASTMSLPEGASREGRFLGHPSRLDHTLHWASLRLGLLHQTGWNLHSVPPASDWLGPSFCSSPITGTPLSDWIPPSCWVSLLRLDIIHQTGSNLHTGLLCSDFLWLPLSDCCPPSFWPLPIRLGLRYQTGSHNHTGPPPSDWASSTDGISLSFWTSPTQNGPPLSDSIPHSFWGALPPQIGPPLSDWIPLSLWGSPHPQNGPPLSHWVSLSSGYPLLHLASALRLVLPCHTAFHIHSGPLPAHWASPLIWVPFLRPGLT